VLVQEIPSYYLGLTYGIFWVLPPLLMLRLALIEPNAWVLVAGAVFSSLMMTVHFIDYRYG
jgi:hypothetical protein